MRFRSPLLAFAFGLSACSVNAGAGVGARFGESPEVASEECVDFESCDIAYQVAVAGAQRCQAESEDCELEEQAVTQAYGELRERTQEELDALRSDAEESEAVLVQEQAAARSEDAERMPRPQLPESPPVARRGNGWFEPEPPPVAH